MMRTIWLAMWVTGLSIGLGREAGAAFVLTAENPGVQSTQVAGVTTEDFNGFNLGTYRTLNTAVGTLTSPTALAIVAADQYGGANGTRYFSVGSQSGGLEATLSFGAAISYFGFWWSAGDPLNQIDFYSGSTLVAQFNTVTALGFLSNAYFANPNPPQGRNPGEKYAYLNFVGTAGTTIDRVVFRNQNLGTGFEGDNFSIRTAPLSGPLPGTVIVGGVINVVPEPSSITMCGLGVLPVLGMWARLRRTGLTRFESGISQNRYERTTPVGSSGVASHG